MIFFGSRIFVEKHQMGGIKKEILFFWELVGIDWPFHVVSYASIFRRIKELRDPKNGGGGGDRGP